MSTRKPARRRFDLMRSWLLIRVELIQGGGLADSSRCICAGKCIEHTAVGAFLEQRD